MASSYVVNARELQRRASLAGQLQHALDSRVIIEQAKGVLAERHGLAVEAAFQLLRHHARQTGTKLHDVARGVVDGSVALEVSANGRHKPSASSAGAAG
jgi:AmiR/NasT family two-component response regulator